MLSKNKKILLWWLLWISVLLLITFAAGEYRIPMLAGFLLAYILEPIGTLGKKYSIPRWVTALVILILVTFFVTLLFAIVLPKIGQEVGQFVLEMPERVSQLGSWLSQFLANLLEESYILFADDPPIWLTELHQELLKTSEITSISNNGSGLQKILALWFGEEGFKDVNSLKDFVDVTNNLFYTYGSFLSNIVKSLRSGLFNILNYSLYLILIIVVYFFIFVGWKNFGSILHSVVPTSAYSTLSKILNKCDSVLSGYFRGMFILVCLMSVYYIVIYLLIGIPYALILGLITGLLTFIPIMGMLTSLTLLLIVTLFPFTGLLISVLGVFALLFGQLIENFILTPRLVGKYIGLHPLATVFAIAIFTQLWGISGTLVAIPVTGVAVQLLSMTNQWLNN